MTHFMILTLQVEHFPFVHSNADSVRDFLGMQVGVRRSSRDVAFVNDMTNTNQLPPETIEKERRKSSLHKMKVMKNNFL